MRDFFIAVSLSKILAKHLSRDYINVIINQAAK